MKTLSKLFLTTVVSAIAVAGTAGAVVVPGGPDVVIVDPGPIGSGPVIGPLAFEVTPDNVSDECLQSNTGCGFHVQFEHPKHVELLLEPPAFNVIIFSFNTQEDISTNFYLTDEFHQEIPGTRRDDNVVILGNLFENPVILTGFENLIFHDFHFEFEFNPFTPGFFVQGEDNVAITFDLGRVGLWVPVPPALALILVGLAGLGLAQRRRLT